MTLEEIKALRSEPWREELRKSMSPKDRGAIERVQMPELTPEYRITTFTEEVQQGLTREQVMGFRFTGEQREAVNRELVRLGMDPLEEVEEVFAPAAPAYTDSPPPPPPRTAGNDELAERQRKFGMMMKPFQI